MEFLGRIWSKCYTAATNAWTRGRIAIYGEHEETDPKLDQASQTNQNESTERTPDQSVIQEGDMSRPQQLDERPSSDGTFHTCEAGRTLTTVGEPGAANEDQQLYNQQKYYSNLAPTERNLIDDKAAAAVMANSKMGVGVLAMGFVFRCAGLFGLVVIIGTAILSNYTSRSIIALLYTDVKDPVNQMNSQEVYGYNRRLCRGYSDIGANFNERHGSLMVNLANFIANLAYSILVLLLAGGLLHHVIPYMSESTWTMICSLPLFPVVFVKRMRTVAIICCMSVVLSTSLLVILTIHNIIKFHKSFPETWSNSLNISLQTSSLAIAFGITVVTYSSTPYLPLMECTMQNPNNLNKISTGTTVIATLLKIVAGFITYLSFGGHTRTLMPLDIVEQWELAVAVILTVLIALLFLVLPVITLFDILQGSFPKQLLVGNQSEPSADVMLCSRIILVGSCILLAIITPYFSLITCFMGAFCGNLLVFIFPSMFTLQLRGSKLSWPEWTLNLVIVLLFSFWGGLGIVYSVSEIRDVFRGHKMEVKSTDDLLGL